MAINLNLIGSYSTGQFDESAAEIPAFDPLSQRLFVVNAQAVTIDVLDLSDPTNPTKIGEIDASVLGGVANSVAVNNGIVAIAIEANTQTDNGRVLFFNTDSNFRRNINPINSVTVGALPDMLTFTPDGSKVVVANEGEPDDGVDPVGSISIIDVSNGIDNATVSTADFSAFNSQEADLRAEGVRIFADAPSVARDLEPEYVAVSGDSTKAYVTLQENNALALVNLETATVEDIIPLGLKDHNLEGNGIDPSDRDSGIDIRNVPVFGMYMPDAIASYEFEGQTYYIIANEGDDRGDADEDERGDAIRVGDLGDVTSFGRNGIALDESFSTEITEDENLGRLTISSIDGDLDGDGDIDRLQSYGTRSFSILDSNGNIVFDSGDELEQIVARKLPEFFNATNDDNDSFENRSDNKGPEPEGVIIGKVGNKNYAFVGLERVGGVVVYDVSDPFNPEFIEYVNNRNFVDADGEIIPVQLDDDSTNPAVGDLGPEGFAFISADDSPNGEPLLVVANEVSGTTSIFEIEGGNVPIAAVGVPPGDGDDNKFSLQVLHASDLEGGVEAIENAANFAAIVDYLEDNAPVDGTVTLSAGDNYLPGPFFNAAGDRDVFRDSGFFNDFYNALYGTDAYDALREGGGRADISIMNAIGFDASAIGNHEFDLGSATFGDLIRPDFRDPAGVSGDRWVGANFPYLSANLDFSNDPELADLFTNEILLNTEFQNSPISNNPGESVPKIAPATLIETGGETIGVVGATTQLLASISSAGFTEVITGGSNNMQALASVLQPVIDEIRNGEDNIGGNEDDVNKIIIVSHLQQIALEEELAGLLGGVDIIIAGGSDTRLGNADDTPLTGDLFDRQYPLITTDAENNPTVIVSTDGEYSYVGQLVVDFNDEGIIIADDGTTLDALEDLDLDNNGPIATTAENVNSLWEDEDPFGEDTKAGLVRDLVDEVSDIVQQQDSNIFGFTDVFLNGNRSFVRTEETNLGNLTADANLYAAQQFDNTVLVSIKNGGGIRAPIGEVDADGNLLPPQTNPVSGKEEGQISQLDITNSLRFNNELTLLTVTAQELANIIEYAVSATEDGATPGQFPQVGGIEFSFDPNGTPIELDADGNVVTAGTRIQNLAIVDENDNITDLIVEDGEVFGDRDRDIRLITLNFLADGGDGYPFDLYGEDIVQLVDELANAPSGSADFAVAGSEQDALAEYLSEFFSTADTAFAQTDVDATQDTRIQNLEVSRDSVFDFFNDLFQNNDAVTFQSNNNLIDRLAYDFDFLFEDLEFNANLTDDVLDLGTEASFDNLVGFYEIADVEGRIDTDGDGVGDLSPTDDGYAKAAITNRVDNFQIRAGSSGDPNLNTSVDEFGDIILAGGKIYSPFVIANAGELGFDGFVRQEENETDGVFNDAAKFFDDNVAYFSFIGANPDGAEHLQSKGNNIFGFEDLPANLGVSDNDFNDAVFGFEFSTNSNFGVTP